MKKLIYLLMTIPILFLTSCSDGGGKGGSNNPTNENLLIGHWQSNGGETEASYFYYDWSGNKIGVLDTHLIFSANDLFISNGYLDGYSINTNGTYNAYTTYDASTWLSNGTGTWNATSNQLTLDDDIMSYNVSTNNLTLYGGGIMAEYIGYNEDLGVDLYVDMNNIIAFFNRVDSFGIISETQSKKEEENNKIKLLKEVWKSR